HPLPLEAARLSPDGTALACLARRNAPGQGLLSLWHVPTGALQRHLAVPMHFYHELTSLGYHPAGDVLAVASGADDIWLWKPGAGGALTPWARWDKPSHLAFQADGKALWGFEKERLLVSQRYLHGGAGDLTNIPLTNVTPGIETMRALHAGRRLVLVGGRD